MAQVNEQNISVDTPVHNPDSINDVTAASDTFKAVKNTKVYVQVNQIPSSNINNMLFGRAPELLVIEQNGEPGYDAASLHIRGLATFNNNSIPVYVDGFRTKSSYLQYMSASEIESIEILKDVASLAPFGYKGANGVIWVTTRRGNDAEPKYTVNLSRGLQYPIIINKPLGTEKFAALYNEANSNDNGGIWSPVFTEGEIGVLPDVDWYDEVLTRATPYTDADISASGGDKNARYFVHLGFMDQNGLYDVPVNDTLSNAGITRINIRTNLDLNIYKFLEAKVDIGARIENRRYPNRSAGDLWTEMASYPSYIYPVQNSNGTWTGTPVYNHNPAASVNALGRVSTHDRTYQANFTLKQKLDDIIPGLYISEAMSLNSWTRDGASNTRNYARYIGADRQTTDEEQPYVRNEDYGQNQWLYQTYEGKIAYDKSDGKHQVSVYSSVLYNIYTTDFSEFENDGNAVIYKHMNIGGAVNYVYEKKYAATISYAYSGSDNFHPDRRWRLYPAVALAWNVSVEDFLRSNSVINNLNIRASAGLTGWDPIGERRYLWERYYYYSGGFRTGNAGGNWNSGLGLLYEGNPDITAESGTKTDVGIDLNLLKIFNFSLNLFYENRSDIIVQDWSVPVTAGMENPRFANIGEVTNKGFELQLGFNDQVNEFKYSLQAHAGLNNNTIIEQAEVITVENAARTGHAINSKFGYEVNGFYSPDDFDENGRLLEALPVPTFGPVQPGDVKYRDINGDMFIDNMDETLIGNPYLPKMIYAFSLTLSYKGFDLFALFQGTYGSEVNLLDNPIQTIAFMDNGNAYPSAERRWAYYPDQGIDTRQNATYPRLSLRNNSNNYQNSTIWIKSGDYLKLRNIDFGYTFTPKGRTSNYMSKFRVALIGINLISCSELISDYDIDPEVLFGHPAMKSYNIGLELTF